MKIYNLFLLKFYLLTSLCLSRQSTVNESWESLLNTRHERVHATHHLNNLIRNNALPNSQSKKNILNEAGITVINNRLSAILPDQMESTYQTTHFNIHYDEGSSSNSISTADLDNNSIPDYAEQMGQIFEEVYLFFKDSLGYDINFLNSQSMGNAKYDIFIDNLPQNYFAITYTTSFLNESSTSCGSYIKMRNNYNGAVFQGLSELENIKITAAHEFFHAIQFSYNCYERFWLMEATAVWSEDELYDDINDHYRYMPSWFQNSSKPIDDESSHMYGSFIFFQYIDEHLGGHEMIKNIWEQSRSIANSINDISFTSIDNALGSINSSFFSALNNMRIANRIMSNNLNASPFTYEEAQYYPVSGPLEIVQLSFENNLIEYTQSYLEANSGNYLKLDISSPANISITVQNGIRDELFSAVIFKHKDRDSWTIRNGFELNIDPSVGLEWATILVNTQSQSQDSWSYKCSITRGESEELMIYNTYPNPFIKSNSKFESRLTSTINQNVKINIYNILGNLIVNKNIPLSATEEKTFKWNLKNSFGKKVSSGIYFIEIAGQNKRDIKKVTILN